MLQQLINPIKLEPVTNVYLCFAEQNIMQNCSFFPYTIKEWNNLSPKICKSVSYEVFKSSLLKFIRPFLNSLFNVSCLFNDSLGIKLLTRLPLGFSHLREHKFNHNFQNNINLLCSSSLESKSTTHFFLCFQNLKNLRKCLTH